MAPRIPYNREFPHDAGLYVLGGSPHSRPRGTTPPDKPSPTLPALRPRSLNPGGVPATLFVIRRTANGDAVAAHPSTHPSTHLDATLCPPVSAQPEIPSGPAADETLAELAKALGHPVRARIVRLLASQQSCQYGDLTDRLPLAKSTVSQHLKVLREAGLVRGDVDGPRVCYCIDPAGLQRLKLLVAAL